MEKLLSQEEIDALLDAVSSRKVDEVRQTPQGKAKSVKLYDFTRPGKVSKDYTRSLHILHRHFARVYSSSLSSLLRTLVEIECTQVEQLTYGDFLMSLSEMSCLVIFSMDPLKGVAVMEIGPQLIFPMVDRLLGGTGMSSIKAHRMTEIEKSIIERAVDAGLEALHEIWGYVSGDIKVNLQRIETDPQYVQVMASADTVMLVVFDVKFGQTIGMMSICYPFAMIEPALLNARPEQWLFNYQREGDEEYTPEIRRKVEKADIVVKAHFPPSKISMKDLLELKVGDIIKLDIKVKNGKPVDPVIVDVGGRKRFLAKPGRVGKKKAVKIIGVLTDEDETTG
jgi:flagellar motor switch protein FliM